MFSQRGSKFEVGVAKLVHVLFAFPSREDGESTERVGTQGRQDSPAERLVELV